jgi:hypothetical protein
MSTPHVRPSFGNPDTTLVRNLRNALIQLKKTIHHSQKIEELNLDMEHFLNASRKVDWPHKPGEVYHKDAAEKAVMKVVSEFQRYRKDIEGGHPLKSQQDLLDAIAIVETMLSGIRESL